MKVLQWEFSSKFNDYLIKLKYCSPNQIAYYSIYDHPEKHYHQNRGLAQLSGGIINVFLDPKLSIEVAEETACHEIEHIELMFQGFTTTAHSKPHTETVSGFRYLCDCLTSTFSDLLIDRKLISLGYNQEEFRLLLFNDTLSAVASIAKGWVNNYPTQCVNVLGICRTALTLNRDQWKRLKREHIKHNAKEYNVGVKVLKIVHQIGFDTPEKYTLLLKSIVKFFGFEKDIYLRNGLSGEPLN